MTVAVAGLPVPKRRILTSVRTGAIPVLTVGILALLILLGLFAEIVAPFPPTDVDLAARLTPPLTNGHLLGTDQLGRDVFSRMIHGARISLTVSLVSVGAAGVLGSALGIACGYWGGRLDAIIMRLAEVILGFPLLIIAILLASAFGANFINVIVILAIGMWAHFARICRADALRIRERPFVAAARIAGASDLQVMWHHILPHVANSIIVMASLQAAWAVVVESSLSFFGAGVPPPHPSWGNMIGDGRNFITTAWWLSLFPGLAVVLLVLSLNLLGDWLRDRFDPTLQAAG